jgi:hypothetical protein
VGDRSEISLALAHFFRGSQTGSNKGDFYARLGVGSESTLQANWLSLLYSLKF